MSSEPLIKVHTAFELSEGWLERYQRQRPAFICVLGFTETALVPNISSAGVTPAARRFTAVADAEFLFDGGPTIHPHYPLPPLDAGISPAILSRAVLSNLDIPIYLFNAGLPIPLQVPHIDLNGAVANCVSSGQALSLAMVEHLFQSGLSWGKQLGYKFANSYLVIGECVVGGTTTAQAVLTALGHDVSGKVNSSHPVCNHQQKQTLVEQGLKVFHQRISSFEDTDPLEIVAAVGDPMQIVVAGMAISASLNSGVLLAGGSQMIAVYRLIQAISQWHQQSWTIENIVVGTTRWVMEDVSSDTLELAKQNGLRLRQGSQSNEVPLLSSQLSFAQSCHPQLQIFEQGFVKEGVGAGGCALLAHLYKGWGQHDLLQAIESLVVSI